MTHNTTELAQQALTLAVKAERKALWYRFTGRPDRARHWERAADTYRGLHDRLSILPSQAVEAGDVLQSRTYHVRSPLTAVAANWASQGTHQLPVGSIDVTPARDEIVLVRGGGNPPMNRHLLETA